ncbi:MAG: vWA domain-containing protein, partial [Planctomycetales bacterium]
VKDWLRSSISRLREYPGLALSVVLHLIVLGCLALVTVAGPVVEGLVGIESLFSDEDRTPEDFQRDLNPSLEIATELNLLSGAPLAAAVGSAGAVAIAQTKIDQSETLQDPTVALNLGDQTLPGLELLGRDLGGESIQGDIGAIADGYGPALDRITQELMRLMRESKILVVWLFDESESMKDDQADLKTRFEKVYEELKLFDDDARADVLLTSIVSYGKEVHFQLPKKRATDDIPSIMKAIDAIPVDKSGVENTCQAILAALGEYRRHATQGRRKVVLIVVSDESGDDGDKVEEALHLARTVRSPIYFLGRESVFGYPWGHVRWIHPQTGGLHYLPIRRGPETPFAEQLQIDGFRRRYDAALSGFGPYEQSRLARDTGGIFFMLPNEEQNLNDLDSRKYAALDLKEYVPDISSRRDYAADRDKSPFRKAVWETIILLNPYDPRNKCPEIPIDNWYSVVPAEAAPPVNATLKTCVQLLGLLTQAEKNLKAVREGRAREPSRRWRADYDLILGQVMAYRVRLFQYMVALDQFSSSLATRKFADKMSNQWAVGISTGEMLPPSAAQLRATHVTLDDLQQARQAALEQFRLVQEQHPHTPWAQRAAWELTRGVGMSFVERYVPPPPKNPPPPSNVPIMPVPNL